MRDFDQITSLLQGGRRVERLPIDTSDDAAVTFPQQADRTIADPASDAPAGGWEAFERKLLAASRGRARQRPVAVRSQRWIPAAASLAAMVLIGCFAFRIGRQSVGHGSPRIAEVPATAPSVTTVANVRLSPQDVEQGIRAFGAVDQSFDGRTRWLLLSANSTDVGLNNQGPPYFNGRSANEANEKLLHLRLNLLRGAEVVSKADVLIVAGATANVIVPTRLGSIHYHIVTSALDPMRMSVQLQVLGKEAAQGIARSDLPVTGEAILGTNLDLKPYTDASAGRLVLGPQAFDLQVAAAASQLPGS